MKRLWLALLVVASGCRGYDTEALCEELDSECNQGIDLADCVEDGRTMEAQASEADCDDELDAYLECLEIGACRWETRCQRDREQLIQCAGDFPAL